MTTLYYRNDDPFSQRVLLAFAYVQPDCAMHAVADQAALPDAYQAKSLPLLATADEVLDNSLEIMDWTLDQKDDNSWVDWDLDEMDDSLYLLSLCDEPFNGYLQACLHADTPAERAEAAACAAGFLEQLDQLLSASTYLLKDEPMLVDYALLPFVRQFVQLVPDVGGSSLPPHLSRWLAALTSDSICQSVFS